MSTKSTSPHTIGLLALVLLITGAIDSVRNLPMTALFGSSLFFFLALSTFIFLLPVALIAAELASTFHDEGGGIYSWVKHAFGESVAFFTIWLQWINTMVWYPTMLSFIAGTLAYLLDPTLAQHKGFLIAVILIVFWSLTLLALIGLRASTLFAGFCAVTGMMMPMAFIIGLGVCWLLQGHPLAIQLDWSHVLPDFHSSQSWASLTAVITSCLGIELAAVHIQHIKNPQTQFPKAILLSVMIILVTLLFGSLAIAIVLPKSEINLVDGVMQAFTNFMEAYHLKALLPLIVISLLLGSLGGMMNWIISPAKGLLMATDHGFLPKSFYQLNRHGVASRILLTQATLVTVLCGSFILFSKINAIYWLLTDLSTELYVFMYGVMFIAAIKLKITHGDLPRTFRIPGGKMGYFLACGLGLSGCFMTFLVGFLPPENAIDTGGTHYFQLIFSAGFLLMILPALCCIGFRRITTHTP